MSEIQAVIFERDYWDDFNAKKELKKMGLRPIKSVHTTKNYLRYRIKDPNIFSRFITKFTRKHLKLVIGFK